MRLFGASWFSSAVALTVSLFAQGCGTPAGTTLPTDAGPEVDAGMMQPDAGPMGSDGGVCTMPVTTKHSSYIPSSLHPTSATRLIVMGDSISAGYGATQPNGGGEYPYLPLAYFSLLIQNVNEVWPTEANTTLTALFGGANITTVSVAHPGDTTANIANDQLTNLTGMIGSSVSGHSIVVITIGGNDMVALANDMSSSDIDNTLNNMISNIRTAINYLQDSTRFPDGTSIYLANVYDPSDSSGVLPYSCFFPGFSGSINNQPLETGLQTASARYQALAQQLGFAVIDDFGAFHGHGLTADMTSDPNYDASCPVDWFYTDCIHPTNAGHNALRRLFFEAISGTYVATDY
jgi:lysophospholipase L1-like esterase